MPSPPTPPTPPAEAYAAALAVPDTGLLAEVAAYTQAHYPGAVRMLSGTYQGRVLAMLARLANPKLIVEIGTFTGYSALCLAEGLADDGRLYTIERDARLATHLGDVFARRDGPGTITPITGPALEVLAAPPWQGPIDLAFVDADKKAYPAYYEALLPQLRPGGLIIFDNVLWKNTVLSRPYPDDTAQVLANLNDNLHEDPRVSATLLPIRDGLLLAIKQ